MKAEVSISEWHLESKTICRHVKVRGRLLLTIKVCFPCLTSAPCDDSSFVLRATIEAVQRFNDCYEKAAEIYMETSTRQMGDETIAAFESLTEVERCCSLRKELLCSMAAEAWHTDHVARLKKALSGDVIRVLITTCYGEARRGNKVVEQIEDHYWQFPQGVWRIPLSKNFEKTQKTIEKT